MAFLQAFRPRTLTRSLVFAGLCLVVAGAAVLVWMLQFMVTSVVASPMTYTRENELATDGQSDQDIGHADKFVDLYGGQAITSSSTPEAPQNTSERQYSVGELDSGTQAHIQQLVNATDADKSFQVKTLDNDYFVAHDDVTDGGQELTGYFKNRQIQKIAYSVGLSLGLKRYLYYFDRQELVYASAEEDDYPATNEGLDYDKTEPVFSSEYFFMNGKLLGTNSKGLGRYLNASTTNADDILTSAQRYVALLTK